MSLTDQQWCPTSVQVTVLQARGLRAKGKSGTNDAYAVMAVGKDKFQTSVEEKSVAPMWREEATFDLPQLHNGGGGDSERTTLHVHVLHRALVGPDKLLGQAAIKLPQLSQDKTRNKTEWFKLLNKSGKADKDRGEVLVDIQFMRNNMTASMMDLSATGKSRSRLGKFKDKVRGKKKESDNVSAVVPSFTQVLTDSEEEGNENGEEASQKNEKKKKHKLKLFSTKSNLQRNISQSMSVLPAKNSSLSGSQSSGLNVDSSEGKKKFKFMIHKRSGSSESKGSTAEQQRHGAADQSNVCINGSHVYSEERRPRTARIGSNVSLTSSGHGSLEDVPDSSTPSADSLRASRQYSPWTEEEEDTADGENIKVEEGKLRWEEEEKMKMDEMRRKEEEEARVRRQEEAEKMAAEKKRQERQMLEEEERRQKEEMVRMEEKRAEEERMRLEEEHKLLEERRRLEEEERRNKEEKVRKEAERIRREEEERIQEERRRQEEQRRKIEEQVKEAERIRREEEERRRQEEERRIEEERVKEMERIQEERRQQEEEKRKIEEQQFKEMERIRKEEEKRIQEERRRQEEERRIEEERVKEMERVRREEEERIQEEWRRQEEEKRKIEEQFKVMERIRKEEEKRIQEERRRQEEERRIEEERVKEEEERIRREEEEKIQEERIRQEEERRKIEEEKVKEEEERIRRVEEERIEEERRQQEEERRKIEEEHFKEMERIRREEEERIQEERRQQEERIKIEEDKVKKEEAERIRKEEEKENRERVEEERRRTEKEEAKKLENRKQTRNVEEQMGKESKMKDRVSGMRSDAEMASTNPFSEDYSNNPFEEDLDSPAGPDIRTAKESAAPQRSQSAVSFLGRRTASTDESDLLSTQREKRPAPQPPGRSQVQSQREHDASTLHDPRSNNQYTGKDLRADSILPQQSMQIITPLSKSPTPANNTQSMMQSNASKGTRNAAKHGKRTAPSIPLSVEEGPASGPKTVPSPDGKIPGEYSSEEKLEHVVHGLNPFEDDEDENEFTAQDYTSNAGSVRWPPAVSTPAVNDAVSQAKITSSKKTRAPPLPVNTSSTLNSAVDQNADGGPSGDGTGAAVSDSGVTPPCHQQDVQQTLEREFQAATVQSAEMEKPPKPLRRLQPVKPLNPLEQQPVSVTQEEMKNESTGFLYEVQELTKVNDKEIKGPYSQLTQKELISLVLKQNNKLLEKDKKILELELYIDNLILRIIEEKPSILMSMNSLK
ncbi:rab11 family-interacting protein 1 [Antennarius striatus]|uniref:rab11 family-interacting protein 1 n=1 Tax=Antennarius striatus TaxID=241820 RepID=UPI0035B165F3